MKTWPLFDENKTLFAFEISCLAAGVGKVATILSGISHVSEIEKRKPFRGPADLHIRFKYHNRPMMVWEPYADNSRFWIGPQKRDGDTIDISEIEEAFREHKGLWIANLFGR